MSDYQSIHDTASALYKALDALAEKRNDQHREAEALALYNAKLQIQKLLGVPPQIAALPVVTPEPEPIDYGIVVTDEHLADGVVPNQAPNRVQSRQKRR